MVVGSPPAGSVVHVPAKLRGREVSALSSAAGSAAAAKSGSASGTATPLAGRSTPGPTSNATAVANVGQSAAGLNSVAPSALSRDREKAHLAREKHQQQLQRDAAPHTINVAVRVRPLDAVERSEGAYETVEVHSNKVIILHDPKDRSTQSSGSKDPLQRSRGTSCSV